MKDIRVTGAHQKPTFGDGLSNRQRLLIQQLQKQTAHQGPFLQGDTLAISAVMAQVEQRRQSALLTSSGQM
ncbi:hypothetical protein [Cupriavidus sp. UYPR2.512]|uniref:hypothetical protein n=1 Tax=Cupriavidus sp. UYPR2.512 TaxID=1080187 RepID=UPI0012F9344A|nr:hypothetical protein [Cupriavidus sp. UYPR2.512]